MPSLIIEEIKSISFYFKIKIGGYFYEKNRYIIMHNNTYIICDVH